jgi:hypothetical protein
MKHSTPLLPTFPAIFFCSFPFSLRLVVIEAGGSVVVEALCYKPQGTSSRPDEVNESFV